MATRKKQDPILAAKKLLESKGYTVKAVRPDPRIGDVVRIWENGGGVLCNMLVTFNQTDSTGPDDTFRFGGVYVHSGTYEAMYTEPVWIDSEEWAKDDGQYEVIGHVDLSKFTTVL
jgi:hypothetical protein